MTTTTRPTGRVTTPAALHLARDYDWRDDAACRTVDPDLHFPVAHTYGWKKQTQAAKKVCAACPVLETCLEWALETGQRAGVWGGLSERERMALSRVRVSSSQVCLDEQVWIERELAKGRSQNSIAVELDVDKATLSRMIRKFDEERATALAMEMRMQGGKAA